MHEKPSIIGINDLVNLDTRQRRRLLGDTHWEKRTRFMHDDLSYLDPGLAYYAHKEDLCVVVKPTSNCDAGCLHCSSYREHDKQMMDEKTLYKMYDVIFSYARRYHINLLTFTWHGGEPTILGKRFYKKAWSSLANIKDIHVINKLQTHLCNLDEEWIALIKKYGVQVGSSVDPIDQGIRLFRGRSMFPQVMKNFARATDQGLGIGFVYVVSPRNMNRVGDFYTFIKNLTARAKAPVAYKINQLYASGRASFSRNPALLISAEQYGRFLIEFWNLIKNDRSQPHVSPFTEWINRRGMSCEHAGGCCEHFLTIDGAGDVYNCGRYFDYGSSLGNIFKAPLEKILMNSRRISLFERGAKLMSNQCRGCLAWDFCHGGCPYFAELYYSDPQEKDPFCESYRMLFYETDILSSIKPKVGNECIQPDLIHA
jgi:uncharacterized protein